MTTINPLVRDGGYKLGLIQALKASSTTGAFSDELLEHLPEGGNPVQISRDQISDDRFLEDFCRERNIPDDEKLVIRWGSGCAFSFTATHQRCFVIAPYGPYSIDQSNEHRPVGVATLNPKAIREAVLESDSGVFIYPYELTHPTGKGDVLQDYELPIVFNRSLQIVREKQPGGEIEIIVPPNSPSADEKSLASLAKQIRSRGILSQETPFEMYFRGSSNLEYRVFPHYFFEGASPIKNSQ